MQIIGRFDPAGRIDRIANDCAFHFFRMADLPHEDATNLAMTPDLESRQSGFDAFNPLSPFFPSLSKKCAFFA